MRRGLRRGWCDDDRGLHLHQLLAEGDGDGFGTVGSAELGEEDREVVLDHLGADAELGGDVGV